MNRPVDMNTVSNTKLASTTRVTLNTIEKDSDEFEWTPPMSSYLLAFIVSKYGKTQNPTQTFGIYARPAAIEQGSGKLALDFGQEMVAKLGEYLGIDYYSVPEIKKMDMAAIPDFSAGGLLNYNFLKFPFYNQFFCFKSFSQQWR